MATAAQVATFIQTIAPLVQKYAKQYGYKVASPIIAQACCESAYGTSWISKEPYFNFFGMKCGSAWKGRSVSARTKEEYQVGVLTSIVDNFRAYDSYEEGVEGYFKFINWSRYANLKTATTPKQYLEYIKADGYATSSTYVNTNMNIINTYGLTKYDNLDLIEAAPVQQPVQAVQQPTFKATGTAVTTANLRMRAGAGTSFSTLLVVNKGCTVQVDGTVVNGWYHCKYGNVVGYMSGNYLKNVQTTSSTPAATRTHKVKSGDTLSQIAKKYGTTVNAIVLANRSKYPKITANYIVVGWELVV